MDTTETLLGRKPAFVLVPGSWCGAWCWKPVADRLRNAGELRHYVIFVLCKELRRLLADSYYLRHIFIAVSLLYQLQYIGVVTACKTSVARNYNEQTVLYLSVSCIYGA